MFQAPAGATEDDPLQIPNGRVSVALFEGWGQLIALIPGLTPGATVCRASGAQGTKLSQMLIPGYLLPRLRRELVHSIQSAMNTFVSPRLLALRFDAKTNFFPSGENIGKPSKVSLSVMRSRPLPSTLIL